MPTSLEEDEAVIERGLGTFREVGEALLRIRDGRKYLKTADANGEMFSTFEDYCQDRWGMSRPYAYQLIDSAKVVSAMADIPADIPRPTTERQARALAPLRSQPARMAEAMSEAAQASGGRPTAAAITKAVERMAEAGAPPTPLRASGDADAARRRSAANGRAICALDALNDLTLELERARQSWDDVDMAGTLRLENWTRAVAQARAALDRFDELISAEPALRRVK